MASDRRLVLASSSPRRRRILLDRGYAFDVAAPDVDEVERPGESPSDMVVRLARAKAAAARTTEPTAGQPVYAGFDTTVVLDGMIVGKPESIDDAVAKLMSLCGRTHRVLTGWALIGGELEQAGIETTEVTMRRYTRHQAIAYVATGEPLDKAGAYGIQGLGRGLVAGWVGSFTNVAGMPIEAIAPLLAELGVVPTQRSRSLGPSSGPGS